MSPLLRKILQEIEQLTIEEKFQIITYTTEQLKRQTITPKASKPRCKWRDIQGKATYPLVGEDAQEWDSRTRQEATENREQIIRNNYES